jgi:hypothetical protein
MPDASPTRDDELVLGLDNVDEFKRIDCVSYKKCLKLASDGDWNQFHCNNCRAYVKEELTNEERESLIRFGKALANVL